MRTSTYFIMSVLFSLSATQCAFMHQSVGADEWCNAAPLADVYSHGSQNSFSSLILKYSSISNIVYT